MLTRLSYAQPMVTGSSMGSSAQFPRLRCHAMCNARAKQNGMGVPVARNYHAAVYFKHGKGNMCLMLDRN